MPLSMHTYMYLVVSL